ncbi:hypothetical protein [Pseudonocardia asaccharolytica]|uniref:Uncharacterized protein n=1 Tax=Pseudonocardia asaccharolytica DSM 44247 = NBRC 16224 TaxID=1123024 RepID=A0A511D6G1_9PSEU|nr:hypothetical protein [Pseudonocardia asaccharolytica]GEL20376.1 hypothetical protein PA7_42130 [Pseudonocardia asaccharolytica DSM 44247 = NBRC 16224]
MAGGRLWLVRARPITTLAPTPVAVSLATKLYVNLVMPEAAERVAAARGSTSSMDRQQGGVTVRAQSGERPAPARLTGGADDAA